MFSILSFISSLHLMIFFTTRNFFFLVRNLSKFQIYNTVLFKAFFIGFLTSLLPHLVSGTTYQIKYLYPNPHLRVSFWWKSNYLLSLIFCFFFFLCTYELHEDCVLELITMSIWHNAWLLGGPCNHY